MPALRKSSNFACSTMLLESGKPNSGENGITHPGISILPTYLVQVVCNDIIWATLWQPRAHLFMWSTKSSIPGMSTISPSVQDKHICHTGAPGLSHFAAVLSAHHGIALQAASFERLNGAEFGADLCELGAQTGFNVGAIRQSNSPPSALNGPPPN